MTYCDILRRISLVLNVVLCSVFADQRRNQKYSCPAPPSRAPHRVQRVVNQRLQVCVTLVSIALLNALHGCIKHAPAHSVFDEAQQIPLSHALRA